MTTVYQTLLASQINKDKVNCWSKVLKNNVLKRENKDKGIAFQLRKRDLTCPQISVDRYDNDTIFTTTTTKTTTTIGKTIVKDHETRISLFEHRTRTMTIITGEDADDDPRTTQTRLLHSSCRYAILLMLSMSLSICYSFTLRKLGRRL